MRLVLKSGKEKIVCAAIHFDDGKKNHIHTPENIFSGFVIAGLRHCNCFGIMHAFSGYDDFKSGTQGFITSFGRFVDRMEGAIIARKSKQVNRKCKILFSEDLY